MNRVAPWTLLTGSLWAASAFHRYDVSVTSSLFASKAPAIGQAATRPLTCSVPAQYSPATGWSAPLRSRETGGHWGGPSAVARLVPVGVARVHRPTCATDYRAATPS